LENNYQLTEATEVVLLFELGKNEVVAHYTNTFPGKFDSDTYSNQAHHLPIRLNIEGTPLAFRRGVRGEVPDASLRSQ